MTDLAKLVVRLEAQTAQYMAQLDKANQRLARFDKQASASASRITQGLALAATAGATAFAAMSKAAIDNADKISKMTQATGISAESLSQLEFAASLSGSSLDGLANGIKKLSKTSADAVRGLSTAVDAFDAIGVSATNADGSLKGTEELLLEVADRFAALEDGAGKAAIAQELFGKSGLTLIPFLNEGRAGIEALKKEADSLGLTLSGKTGKSAELFNDNLERLQFATKGLVNQFVTAALPTLVTMSERFVSAAKSGGALDFAVKALSVTFKTVVSAGVIVTSIFEQLGRVIYGVAAAVVRVAQGEFRLAAGEIKDAFSDARSNVADDMETVARLWSDMVPEIEGAARDADDALKDTLIFGDDKAGKAARKAVESALDSLRSLAQGLTQQVDTYGMAEVAVIRYRLAQGDLSDEMAAAGPAAQAYADQIVRATEELERLKKTTEESEARQREWDMAVDEGRRITEQMRTPAEVYADSIQRLNELLAEGHILQETYNRAVEAAQETFDDATKEQNKFLEQANRNIQDILGKGIEDIMQNGFRNGARGALDAFRAMLDQMVAQALAAQIAKKIFGEDGLGSGGGLIGGLGDLFGGSRDGGGRGQRGKAYLIGTGAQPELFVPDTSGDFIPAGQLMGGARGVNQNIYVQGQVTERTARQLSLEAARRQRQAQRIS